VFPCASSVSLCFYLVTTQHSKSPRPPLYEHQYSTSTIILFSRFIKVSAKVFFLLASAMLALAASVMPAAAEHSATTLSTLLGRAQIEDMLVDYYAQLGSGRHDFGAFYLEDGILEVNGLIAQGKKAFEDFYKKTAEGTPARVSIDATSARNDSSPAQALERKAPRRSSSSSRTELYILSICCHRSGFNAFRIPRLTKQLKSCHLAIQFQSKSSRA
jgi:hypothetical protein